VARRHAVIITGFVLNLVFVSGCGRGERIAHANDELRAENARLKNENDQLARRGQELESELARTSSPPSTLPEQIRANIPHVAEIKIGGLSHVSSGDGSGPSQTLTLYLHPADGLGRFVQIVGSVSVNAVIVPPDSDPIAIGRATFGPSQVRDAYRSTITGVHYSFDVPIQMPEGSQARKLDHAIVRVTLTDGLTGKDFSAERSINLQ